MQSDLAELSIFGIKPGHDGAVAHIQAGKLDFAYESEKDNSPRYSDLDMSTILKAMAVCARVPDIIATGGWSKGGGPDGIPIEAGYLGVARGVVSPSLLFGKNIQAFSSTHERSHILCSYGLSPFEQGHPCYALVWEGHIGAFYSIDENVGIVKLANVLTDPGVRYAFLYALADPTFKMGRGMTRLGDAGKLMALAAYGREERLCAEGRSLVAYLLEPQLDTRRLHKDSLHSSRFYNCGVLAPEFADLVRHFSDQLFEVFDRSVRPLVTTRRPLLISGGCGLNCEWNSRWIASRLFSDVFIPPCTNDSGSAIGTAVDALAHATGIAKVTWSVFAGAAPHADVVTCAGYLESPIDTRLLAERLGRGDIFGWMRGRSEMGPRSLGARSILASPTSPTMLARLNAMKGRESFRPIAPVCPEEFMGDYFDPPGASPFMLQFRTVRSEKIPAVTHVDGSARPQSVTAADNPVLHELLIALRATGQVPVLCNTSLNFNGSGFLNRLSDLHRFSDEHGLDGFVFQDRMFTRAVR